MFPLLLVSKSLVSLRVYSDRFSSGEHGLLNNWLLAYGSPSSLVYGPPSMFSLFLPRVLVLILNIIDLNTCYN